MLLLLMNGSLIVLRLLFWLTQMRRGLPMSILAMLCRLSNRLNGFVLVSLWCSVLIALCIAPLDISNLSLCSVFVIELGARLVLACFSIEWTLLSGRSATLFLVIGCIVYLISCVVDLVVVVCYAWLWWLVAGCVVVGW